MNNNSEKSFKIALIPIIMKLKDKGGGDYV